MPYFVLGLVTLLLWVYCLVDVITRDESDVRHLPKVLWLLIVLVLPTIGSLVWLFVGRGAGVRRTGATRGFGEYERPGRHIAQNPDDDEAFLRRCRERAEEQRRIARRRREEPGDD
ncbi:PLDc N-terminal domain-containing protein [Rhodococcus sp. FXJ9.536]|uniref:PLDc N-terminal domain-containing protein n=1 Tax=Rhodococcus tibetensis TaxID=2965064 RepID=A0ABT1QD54_9NOCA|nr:PLDc N-terminal domain-containing protein [Rhodococcus sp. FXJ9.536]MCQ4119082.1 PLDc N-terminal domain-containing protein [Rhodococcus sp. FXJ9.536]